MRRLLTNVHLGSSLRPAPPHVMYSDLSTDENIGAECGEWRDWSEELNPQRVQTPPHPTANPDVGLS